MYKKENIKSILEIGVSIVWDIGLMRPSYTIILYGTHMSLRHKSHETVLYNYFPRNRKYKCNTKSTDNKYHKPKSYITKAMHSFNIKRNIMDALRLRILV